MTCVTKITDGLRLTCNGFVLTNNDFGWQGFAGGTLEDVRKSAPSAFPIGNRRVSREYAFRSVDALKIY